MRVHGRFVVPFAGAVCIGGWVACEAVEFARPSDAACKVASGPIVTSDRRKTATLSPDSTAGRYW